MSSENNAYIPQGLQHSKDAQGETFIDTLPSSWSDSNMNLKWKQRNNKELGHAP